MSLSPVLIASSSSSSPTNFEVVVANGRQFVPIMAAPAGSSVAAALVAQPTLAVRPVVINPAMIDGRGSGSGSGSGGGDVFRSMKVGSHSKTPYSDATQVQWPRFHLKPDVCCARE